MNPSNHRHIVRVATSLACGVVVVLGAGGCGGQSNRPASMTGAARGDVPTMEVKPGPPSVEIRREHDQLVGAYEPVSDYMNSVVGAQRLHANRVLISRRVIFAIDAYQRRLLRSQRRLRSFQGITEASPVREQLMASIAARRDALAQMRRMFAVARTNPSLAEQLRERWVDAWDASVGSARQATNLMQQEREDVGLAPMREDSLR